MDLPGLMVFMGWLGPWCVTLLAVSLSRTSVLPMTSFAPNVSDGVQ